MPQQRPERDALDESLEIWAREIPDLDPLTEGIIERIQILAFNVNQSMDETLAEFELDRRSFLLLGKLRRHGPPYQVSAGRLATELRLSSGAMTNRLDRMEAAGLVRRLPDPNDRRGTLVEPTKEGHAAWDEAVGAQARREALFSSVLSDTEKERLHVLLRHLMLAFPDWKHKKHGAHDAADAADAAGAPASASAGKASA
ncbi:MAG TPA: MarR family transcriptional regulator [Candidatus Limnocylindria bacterium]|nr:MarR family transcriptional regulator [Candidatus Limnocylindria bacterium]